MNRTTSDGAFSLTNSNITAQLTFSTNFFKPIPGEDLETNPGCFGKDLANWLSAKLVERGMAVERVIPEDFGWVILLSRKPFLVWVGCCNVESSLTEWTIFPVVEAPFFKRLFKSVDPIPELDKVTAYLSDIVALMPGVTSVSWQ